MKSTLLAGIVCAVAGFTNIATAQTNMTVHMKDGSKTLFNVDEIEEITFDEPKALTPAIYTSGIYTAKGKQTACYWKNSLLQTLELPDDANNSFARGIQVVDGKVYISGMINKNGTPCYWIDGKRTDLTVPEGTTYTDAYSMTVANGSTYIGGYTYAMSGDKAFKYLACYWKDGVINYVTLPTNFTFNSDIRNIEVVNGKVYAAGNVDTKPYLWTDGQPTALALPEGVTKGNAFNITVFGSDIYVSGQYKGTDKVDYACYWKNGELVTLEAAPDMAIGGANDIAVNGTDVYAVGYSTTKDMTAQYDACIWKNGKYESLSSDANAAISNAKSVTVYDGKVYVAGTYNANGIDTACYWVEGQRFDIALPEGAAKAECYGIAVVGE